VLTGPAVVRWLAVALCAAIAVHCLVRAALARHRVARPGLQRDAEAAHGVMALAMSGMLSPFGDPVPAGVWLVVFVGLAGWFGARVWHARASAPGGRPAAARVIPHVHHLVAALAMVFMAALIPLTTRGSGSAASAMSGMSGMSGMSAATGASFPVAFGSEVLAVGLLCYFVLYAAWSMVRVVRVPAGMALAGGGTLAGSPPVAVRLVLSPRIAVCCQSLMGLGMAYMLRLMR
jgi:hypothetical protein